MAVIIGGTVGVGILRNPGGVAEQIPSVWLIMFAWTLGGVYCLLGANYLAELAAMMPKAGGYYVYAQRAYGDFGGFVVGWSDWLYATMGLSFIAVVFGEYASELLTPELASGRIIFSGSILVLIALLNLIGLRSGSATQKLTSLVKTVALIAFVIACFIYGGQADTALIAGKSEITTSGGTFAQLVAFILAFQLILGTYDGWHSAIYFSEEDTDPTRNVPRSLFVGVVAIIGIYLLVNFALLYVLPMSQLSGSKFAGAEAMSLIFGARSGQIVTVLALLSLIGIINALMMLCPRILLALSRDRLFTPKAAIINKGGTPVVGLAVTALTAIVLSSIGSFEMLLAISQFLAVVIAIMLVISLFILRRRDPEAPRPFRAWGYPFAPLLVLVIAVLLFFGYIVSNPYPSAYALVFLALSYPLYRAIKKFETV